MVERLRLARRLKLRVKPREVEVALDQGHVEQRGGHVGAVEEGAKRVRGQRLDGGFAEAVVDFVEQRLKRRGVDASQRSRLGIALDAVTQATAARLEQVVGKAVGEAEEEVSGHDLDGKYLCHTVERCKSENEAYFCRSRMLRYVTNRLVDRGNGFNKPKLFKEVVQAGVNSNVICLGCTMRVEASSTSSETMLPAAS